MPSIPRAASAAVPLLLLAALVACTPPAGGSGGTGEGDPEGDGGEGARTGASTECVSRTWALDINDAAAQLGEHLASSGMSVISTSGEGVQTISFAQDGQVTTHNDVTFMVSADGGEGVEITVVQTHSGDTAGEWYWEGDSDSRVAFDAYDSGEYTISTTTLVNGMAGEPSTTTPTGGEGGSGMSIDCSADGLATQADGSPFTQHWVPRD